MNTTQAQQKALDDALVALADRFEFRKCNMRLKTNIKPKEATFKLSICYRHQQVLKWQRNWNGQDSSVPCSNTLGFTKIIIDYFMSKDQSISRRNKMFWYTARDDTMFTSMRCISRHKDTQVYGTILPKELTNQAIFGNPNAYKTYKPLLLEENSKTKKEDKAKGLAVLSKVALTKAEQLKLATKRSKIQFHSSHTSGSGDGVDTQSKVPDEQQQKSSGIDEGIGTKLGVPDVPIYKSKSKKESWDDSEDEDDENDSDDLSDEGDDNNDGGDDDANDEDKQEGDETNDDNEEIDSDRTESDKIKIPILDQSTTKYYEEEEEENIDD
ncbi:hypothetical protein Tco_0966311 [Tanacetum coccineum]